MNGVAYGSDRHVHGPVQLVGPVVHRIVRADAEFYSNNIVRKQGSADIYGGMAASGELPSVPADKVGA